MREDAPHRPGSAVRGYRVERLIGTGGAAAVYEARQLGPGGPGERVSVMFARTAIGKFAPLPPETPADLAQLIPGLIRSERDARRPQTATEALALLRGHGLPMASADELASMVAPAQARRDQELESARPESVLPPGYVLAPRDALEAADTPGAPMFGPFVGRAAEMVADRAADAVPHHMIDAVVERVSDGALEREVSEARGRVPGAVPRRVTRSAPGVSEGVDYWRLRGARRSVAGRALLVAAIVTCVLVPAVLLDDGSRGQQAAIDPVRTAESPAPVVVAPAPAPPVAPVVVTPVPAPEPRRRAAEPADGLRSKRAAVDGRDRHAKPPAPRWRSAPHLRRPPPWGQR
jgi:hypothetical protein